MNKEAENDIESDFGDKARGFFSAIYGGIWGFILLTILGTIPYYFSYVYLLDWEYITVLITVIFTAFNIIAALLSWSYFNATKDYDAEANAMLQWSYRKIGEDIPHIILIIGRILINFILVYDLFTDIIPIADFFLILDFKFYSTIFIFSAITSLYTFEMIYNASNNIAIIREAIYRKEHGLSMDDLVNTEKPEWCIANPDSVVCNDTPALESTAINFIKVRDAVQVGKNDPVSLLINDKKLS